MILLATDLDRTLLPNGPAPYDGSLPKLLLSLERRGVRLAYVTGRNLALVDEAREEFSIPYPDFLVAEVGTVLYRNVGGKMDPYRPWREHILSCTPGWNREEIVRGIGGQGLLKLQEGWKQNEFKISYYLADHTKKEEELAAIRSSLGKMRIDAEVIWSVDPLADDVGLIDILPVVATKIAALEFIRSIFGISMDKVIYCGDSGNDLLPLSHGYRAIVVKNAPDDVKTAALRIASEKGIPPPYIATGGADGNGNYSSGILEGLRHYGVL